MSGPVIPIHYLSASSGSSHRRSRTKSVSIIVPSLNYVPAALPVSPHHKRHSRTSSQSHVYYIPAAPQPVTFDLRFHEVLDTSYTRLVWDMRAPLFTAYQQGVLPTHTSVAFNEAAVAQGAVDTITILSEKLMLPITIYPNPQGVMTVHDILSAIYSDLRMPLSHEQWNSMTPQYQAHMAEVFRDRYRSIPDRATRETERAKGIRRVDFLLHRRRFAGLRLESATPVPGRMPSLVWRLELASV